MPNTNHNIVPNVNNEYIDREMPLVSFVLMVCSACGRKERVVQNAAIKPIMVVVLNIDICFILPQRAISKETQCTQGYKRIKLCVLSVKPLCTLWLLSKTKPSSTTLNKQ